LVLGESDGFVPCTPGGVQELLVRSGTKIDGAEVVILGRGNIVGKPLTSLLMQRGNRANGTVTIVHSGTRAIRSHCLRADILVAAVGRPEMVKGDWIKPGAVVIDAGYNKVEGRKFDVGDVAFDDAKEVAGWITPVPGGVGPMTVASLLGNCVTAAELRLSRGTV
jgi:methylenetetrahydrofolate dehydrogenase (NADP+)/methenyltetrahydrofolate cyclohydrolase